jgi:DNA-binding NarL/FixJ family response regulator
MSENIKITIIEDNKPYRKGLELIINGTPGFECLATFGSCEEALENFSEIHPDILLLDIELPGMMGFEGIPKFKSIQKSLDIIILTDHGKEDYLFKALKNGACGYLIKTTEPAKLLEGVKIVFDGGSVMSPQIARMLSDYFNKETSSSPLTRREAEVLRMAGEHNSNNEIADALFISVATVRTHFKNIYFKLDVHSKTEAYSKAKNKNWI